MPSNDCVRGSRLFHHQERCETSRISHLRHYKRCFHRSATAACRVRESSDLHVSLPSCNLGTCTFEACTDWAAHNALRGSATTGAHCNIRIRVFRFYLPICCRTLLGIKVVIILSLRVISARQLREAPGSWLLASALSRAVVSPERKVASAPPVILICCAAGALSF